MKRPLSKSQIVCISLLWLALCYLVLTKAERIDGMTIVMLVISAALVFIPVYKILIGCYIVSCEFGACVSIL